MTYGFFIGIGDIRRSKLYEKFVPLADRHDSLAELAVM
jgi:hypothetical protein